MRAERYLVTAEWLNNLMLMLLYYVAAESLCYMIEVDIRLFCAIMIPVMISIFYLMRVYITKLSWFVAAHLACITVFAFIPVGTVCKIVGFILIAVFVITDFEFWKNGGVRSFIHLNVMCVIAFVLVFGAASYNGIEHLARVSYVCGICFMGMYFIRVYLTNGIKFLNDAQVNANTPVEEMFRHNGMIVFPLILIFTIGMFLIQSQTMADALWAIIKFFGYIARRIIIFIASLIPDAAGEEEVVSESIDFTGLPPVKPYPQWISSFIEALEKVLSMLLAVSAVYFLIKSIVRFIRMYFERHGYELLSIEREDHTEISERIRHGRAGRLRNLFGAVTESERIRRRYRNEVERMKRRGYHFRKEHTPAERLKDVTDTYEKGIPGDFGSLTLEYEKVRYNK